MSAARWVPDISTPEAFVAWMEVQPYKHEMIMGRLVMMADGTNARVTIGVNTLASLHAPLRGSRCRVYSSDFMVFVTDKNFYYPDLTVACDERRNFTDHPIIVVEVLSETTRREDLGPKLEAYRSKPGLRTILYLHQDRPLPWLWEEGRDERQVIEGEQAVIELPALGIVLPLAEVYDGVEFGVEPS